MVDNPVPVIHPPRTVPVHIMPLYKAELERMIADDIITEVKEPTDWVNSIVCNIKETPEGKKKVRLCLDPKDLNKSIRREHYYTRNIDELLPLLYGKMFFSVVDTKKGYWHVELDDESSFLCTFNTPFGRYRFKRLPFGVIVSQDIFQRKLDEVYNGIPNVMGIADDILVCGSTEQEHDHAFIEMLKATRAHNVSLNSEKLQFKQSKIDFFGHTLTEKGIQPAKDKLETIRNIKTPSNVKELQTLLGMVTYLNRYSSQLATLTAPLRELTKKHVHFKWEPYHQQALDQIKKELCSAKILSYYDPLLGREVIVETDHSPLEQIFRKNLADAPARLQRMLLRCLRFDVQVKYKPGKSIPVADALSRVCLQKKVHSVESLPPEEHSIHFLSTPVDLTEIKLATTEDSTMQLLKDIIFKGWPPHRRNCPQELCEFWNFRCDLVLEDGLVLKGNRIVIPTSMRNQVLKAIHLGHQGETKCILRARESVFWPGISNDIRQMVKDCGSCNHHQPVKPKLPIMQPDLPTRPWEKLGTDIFEFNNRKYLMIVDYYSRFPVMRLLSDMTANTICNHFTSVLAEYGLPAKITTDFGPQYISEHFRAKCQQSGITLDCSSPYHHQANSLAENAIGTCKSILKKAVESNQCPYTAIWMYRTTPLDNQMPSPYELLFGRKPQTTLPTSRGSLKSKHPHNDAHQEANQQRQMKQAESYNAKVGNDRRILNNQEPVYVRDTLRNTYVETSCCIE